MPAFLLQLTAALSRWPQWLAFVVLGLYLSYSLLSLSHLHKEHGADGCLAESNENVRLLGFLSQWVGSHVSLSPWISLQC